MKDAFDYVDRDLEQVLYSYNMHEKKKRKLKVYARLPHVYTLVSETIHRDFSSRDELIAFIEGMLCQKHLKWEEQK